MSLPASDERLLYRVKDACAALGLSRSTLWELTARGELHAVRVGRRVLYSKDELERFVAKLTNGEDEEGP